MAKSKEQEIPEGYKQTEIGVIPEDWDVELVCDFGNVITGGTPPTRIKEYWNGNIPWVTPTDIKNDKNVVHSEREITESGLNVIRKLPADALLVTCIASIGKNAILRKDGACNQQINAIVPNKKHNVDFLYYLFENFKQYLLSHAGITATNIIPKQDFSVIAFGIPKYSEQVIIGSVLSGIDLLIDRIERLIEKKTNIKQGTMQELLTGKHRLPGFDGKWEIKLLAEECWFQEGPGLRNWQFTKSGMKVINVTNLERGYLNLERTTRYISMAEFNKMYRHFEIDEKDIVVASSGNSYAKVAVVRQQDLPLVMNTSVIRFKPLKNLDYDFFLAFLKSNYFKNQIDLLITGGAQPNFGPFHLRKIEMNVPPTKDEQFHIARILSDMDSEIEKLELQLTKYKNIKQGMMQNLLTGKIRLSKKLWTNNQ